MTRYKERFLEVLDRDLYSCNRGSLRELSNEGLVYLAVYLGGMKSVYEIYNKSYGGDSPECQEAVTKIRILEQKVLEEAERRDRGF